MSTTPRYVLIDLVAQLGEPLLASPLRCEALLKDYCGEFRREIFVLVSCLRVGVVDQLRRQSGPSIKLICARLALKLEQNLATSGDVAKWAVESWAIALGMLAPENATALLMAAPTEIDYATESPPVPDVRAAIETVEYLAREPEPRWAVPDWTQPATTVIVHPDGSGQKPGLREAVRAAGENACLRLRPGVYRESLVIKKNLQLRPDDDAAVVTLESQSASVFVIDGACLFLSRLIIKGLGGRDKKTQAAIEIKSGHLIMEDCNATSDSSTVVEVKGAQSEAYLRRCHLHDGKAGGILFAEDGAGYLEECHLYKNKLSQVVIGKGCSPVITHCKISHALMAGIYVSEGGEGLIENSDIWGNAVGGVQCRRGAKPHFRHCRISSNERYGLLVGEQGQGLYEHCQIFDNAKVGVSVAQQSNPIFVGCQIFDNRGEGVEISEQGQGEFLDCEIFANEAANVCVKDKSTPGLFRCVIHDGQSEGLVVSGQAQGRFEGCEISANARSGVLVTLGAKPAFRECVLHHGLDLGLSVTMEAEGQFIDCEVTHHASTAIMVSGQAQPRFERCHVRENLALGVSVEDATPVFQSCVIEQNTGTGFLCLQGAMPVMTEGEISANHGGLIVSGQGKGRWEQVHFLANRGDSVLVAEGGRPALRLCHIEAAEGIGLRFSPLGQGTIEEVDIMNCTGPGIQVEAGGNPTLKSVRVRQGRAGGIVLLAQASATVEACEVTGNAGGDWLVDATAHLSKS